MIDSCVCVYFIMLAIHIFQLLTAKPAIVFSQYVVYIFSNSRFMLSCTTQLFPRSCLCRIEVESRYSMVLFIIDSICKIYFSNFSIFCYILTLFLEFQIKQNKGIITIHWSRVKIILPLPHVNLYRSSNSPTTSCQLVQK